MTEVIYADKSLSEGAKGLIQGTDGGVMTVLPVFFGERVARGGGARNALL